MKTKTSMPKRFAAFFLAVIMCLSLFPTSAFAENEPARTDEPATVEAQPAAEPVPAAEPEPAPAAEPEPAPAAEPEPAPAYPVD